MTEPPTRYDDLRALFINGTLKRSPERSHTRRLLANPPPPTPFG